MKINVYTVGGYNEVGKNMTVVELSEDAFIFDCGLYLPPVVELENKEHMDEKLLREIDALPNDLFLDKLGLRSKVKAIAVSHAHLDHVGSLPFLAYRYDAPILATPFTAEVLKSLIRDITDEKAKIRARKNKIISIMPNSSYSINAKKIHEVEFIHVTHSTLQTAIIALHTDEGIIMYANDFKLDNTPTLGKKPNYERLKKLAKQGIKALIVESLYAADERKTPSERIAYDLLEDVMLGTSNENSAIVVTTFSSHIARLNSIVKIANKLGRTPILFGRSLKRYTTAAKKINMLPFDAPTLSFKTEIQRGFKKVAKNKTDYVVICTGHQGEQGSILDRLSKGQFKFKLSKDDHVIFSSRTIPSPINIANRQQLEKRLKEAGVRIFTDVHISGHAGREDLRDFIRMLNPEHIIPAHGELQKRTALAELASELGYSLGYNIHLTENGKLVMIN